MDIVHTCYMRLKSGGWSAHEGIFVILVNDSVYSGEDII